jgi:hypothetical protein
MGGMLFKQSNGRYGRFSSVVEEVTHMDMTKEDYIDICQERAQKEALELLETGLYSVDEVIEYLECSNSELAEEQIQALRDMEE